VHLRGELHKLLSQHYRISMRGNKTEEFRSALTRKLRLAELGGKLHVEINAGDLHRKVGGYPGPNHRMSACCDAMYQAQREGDQIVARPPRGKGASLTIRYRLPRPPHS
jgi:hypothetical protein